MTWSGDHAGRALRAMLCVLMLAACGDEPTDEAPPAGLVLEIDGLRIWEHEIEPLLAYVASVDRRLGRNSAIAGILDNHLIPLKLAQRAFADERRRMRERADALARAVGNGGYPELVAKGTRPGEERPVRTWMRHELPLPVAAWVFDAARIGHVSPPIETPQGFSLVSTWEIVPGATAPLDRAEACQVSFYTHEPAAFAAWLDGARAAAARAVGYVHPDYRRALPPWIEAP